MLEHGLTAALGQLVDELAVIEPVGAVGVGLAIGLGHLVAVGDEDRARDADVTFEIRLTGEGGGSWTVRIENGSCEVRPGFATRPDVRYMADSSIWCGLALGLLDARDLVRSGKLAKEGSRDAMDHYFHQMRTPEARKGANSNRADEMGQTKKTSKEIER